MADRAVCRIDIEHNAVPSGYSTGRGPLTVLLWWLVQDTLFRWSPRPAYGWRRLLLRLFGADIAGGVRIRPTARIEFPWRLRIGAHSTVGDDAWLYTLAPITLGAHCTVSQRAFLCTGSHDPDDPHMTLQVAPITLGDGVWVAAEVFVAPGVEIGAETAVGARSTVLRSLPAGMVCFGSPCEPRRERRLPQAAQHGADDEPQIAPDR
ncbi:MAG: colanic acid biosynthesis acetyltransferase WcaF [Armatimonadetes bacterium]|nr:colanic acid biosynthesis acetyltransferase WcaF [Armatimonadota bacterium]